MNKKKTRSFCFVKTLFSYWKLLKCKKSFLATLHKLTTNVGYKTIQYAYEKSN